MALKKRPKIVPLLLFFKYGFGISKKQKKKKTTKVDGPLSK